MTTAELLELPELTCYWGPTRDRPHIKKLSEKGELWFQIHVPQCYLGPTEPSIKGSFRTVEEAVALAKKTPHGEVHAIAAGFNFPESLLYADWWNPYNL